MPRTCTICRSARRAEIDLALVSRHQSFRDIARQFRVGKDALGRHLVDHVPEQLAKAQGAQAAADGGALLARLLTLSETTLEILAEAREGNDGPLALQAIGRAEKQIELQAKLVGELQASPTVNILVSPEWQAVQGALLAALQPFPEARSAVTTRLQRLQLSAGANAVGA